MYTKCKLLSQNESLLCVSFLPLLYCPKAGPLWTNCNQVPRIQNVLNRLFLSFQPGMYLNNHSVYFLVPSLPGLPTPTALLKTLTLSPLHPILLILPPLPLVFSLQPFDPQHFSVMPASWERQFHFFSLLCTNNIQWVFNQ